MIRAPSLLLALLLACAACGGSDPAAARPRLVVLYATCTLNKDYLQPYRASVGFTPGFARFAAESVTFAKHHTEDGQSGPAFASIFTGTQADRHGVYNHPTWLTDDAYTIGEAFRDAGYETWFWNGHKAASARLNYGQGIPKEHTAVSSYLDLRGAHPGDPALTALLDVQSANDRLFESLLERLRSEPDLHAFVLVNFSVTHSPYHNVSNPESVAAFLAEHPEEDPGLSAEELARALHVYEENRFELQWDFPATVERLGLTPGDVDRLSQTLALVYEASVHQLDGLFGRFVEKIRASGLIDESLIAFTADHGEALYRENALFKWTHGMELAPEVLNVPWILRSKALGLAPRTYDGVTRSIDVFPTIAGLCGVELPPGSVDGVDLAPALLGRAPQPELDAYSHTSVISEAWMPQVEKWTLLHGIYPRTDPELMWTAVRRGDLLYERRSLDGARWESRVFDLATDRGETRDLYDPEDAEQAEAFARLAAYKARLVERYHQQVETSTRQQRTGENRLKVLQDLGYAK